MAINPLLNFPVNTITFKNLPNVNSASIASSSIIPIVVYDSASGNFYDRSTTIGDLSEAIGQLNNFTYSFSIVDTSSLVKESQFNAFTNSYYIDSGSFSSSIASISSSLSLIDNSLNNLTNSLSSSFLSITKYEIDSASLVDSTIYTNINNTPSNLGGIPAGSSFNSQSILDILTQLLYPYQSPAFTSFYINGQSSTLEVGSIIPVGSVSFYFSTSNTSNISPNSLVLKDVTGGQILLSGQPVFSPITTSINTIISEDSRNAIYQWSLGGVNSENVSMSNAIYTVTWESSKYVGSIPYSSLSALQSSSTILELFSVPGISFQVNSLDGNSRPTGTYNFNFSSMSAPGGLSFWLYASALGTLTFTQGGFSYPTNVTSTGTWTNSNNINVGNYYLYISSNPTQGTFTVVAS